MSFKFQLYFLAHSRLYNLQPSDSGYYICNAQNTAGRTRDYVYLEVSPQSGGVDNNQDREQQEREREQQEREREQQEREREQQEREREQQEREREQSDQKKLPIPLVIISSMFNGQPIEVGSDMKLVCTVNGKV